LSIKAFKEKYPNTGKSVFKISERWQAEQAARDFLGTTVFGTIVLGDLITGDHIFDVDKVPDEIVEAMKQVFPNRVETVEEAVQFLAEKNLNGDASVRGTVNAIQGRLGEFQFQRTAGDFAELADNPIQQHYDVKISLPDEPVHYVQVKVYKDPNTAFDKFEELNAALLKGEVVDGADQVSKISFAVNDNLVEELTAKAVDLNSNIKIIPIGANYDEIRSAAASGVEDHAAYLDDFFGGLFGGLVVGAALHTCVNGFLVYRGHKAISVALEDTAYSTVVTGGGVAAVLGADALGFVMGGPLGFCLMLGVGGSTRAILNRVADRRHYSKRVTDGNIHLLDLCGALQKIA
jgi:hypothetical protein